MKELQTRRAMDLEGFTADVTTLRKLLNAVDRRLHQTRLVQRLDDDERLDLLLEQLERRAPDPSGLNDEVAPNTNSKKPSGYVGARDAGEWRSTFSTFEARWARWRIDSPKRRSGLARRATTTTTTTTGGKCVSSRGMETPRRRSTSRIARGGDRKIADRP